MIKHYKRMHPHYLRVSIFYCDWYYRYTSLYKQPVKAVFEEYCSHE